MGSVGVVEVLDRFATVHRLSAIQDGQASEQQNHRRISRISTNVPGVYSAGDVNGDGFNDLIVAAHGYDNPDQPGELNHGRVMIWFGSETGLLEYNLYEHADCLIDTDIESLILGVTVAGLGDVDGDGLDDVAASGWSYTNGHSAEGIVYAFSGLPLVFVDGFESADDLRWPIIVP